MPSLRAGASVHSEQHLVSLVPFPEGPSFRSPRPCPVVLSSQLAALPAVSTVLHFRLRNRSWPSCPWQERVLGQNVMLGLGVREGRERILVGVLVVVVSLNHGK